MVKIERDNLAVSLRSSQGQYGRVKTENIMARDGAAV